MQQILISCSVEILLHEIAEKYYFLSIIIYILEKKKK